MKKHDRFFNREEDLKFWSVVLNVVIFLCIPLILIFTPDGVFAEEISTTITKVNVSDGNISIETPNGLIETDYFIESESDRLIEYLENIKKNKYIVTIQYSLHKVTDELTTKTAKRIEGKQLPTVTFQDGTVAFSDGGVFWGDSQESAIPQPEKKSEKLDAISFVRNGYFSFDPSITVASGLENYEYYSRPQWDFLKEKNTRTFVVFMAYLDFTQLGVQNDFRLNLLPNRDFSVIKDTTFHISFLTDLRNNRFSTFNIWVSCVKTNGKVFHKQLLVQSNLRVTPIPENICRGLYGNLHPKNIVAYRQVIKGFGISDYTLYDGLRDVVRDAVNSL